MLNWNEAESSFSDRKESFCFILETGYEKHFHLNFIKMTLQEYFEFKTCQYTEKAYRYIKAGTITAW